MSNSTNTIQELTKGEKEVLPAVVSTPKLFNKKALANAANKSERSITGHIRKVKKKLGTAIGGNNVMAQAAAAVNVQASQNTGVAQRVTPPVGGATPVAVATLATGAAPVAGAPAGATGTAAQAGGTKVRPKRKRRKKSAYIANEYDAAFVSDDEMADDEDAFEA